MIRLILLVCMLVMVAACGDPSGDEDTDDLSGPTTQVPEQDGGDSAATDTTSVPRTATTLTTESTETESPAAEVGEAGSFSVNGTEFAVTLLNRCIPFSGSDDDLDVQALADGAKLNLVLFGDTTEVSVDGSGVEEMFGSIAFGENPVVEASEVTGDRWTGSATVGDSLGSGATVDLAWDVMVPAEAQDCGL